MEGLEKTVKYRLGQLMSVPRFEPATSHIQSRSTDDTNCSTWYKMAELSRDCCMKGAFIKTLLLLVTPLLCVGLQNRIPRKPFINCMIYLVSCTWFMVSDWSTFMFHCLGCWVFTDRWQQSNRGSWHLLCVYGYQASIVLIDRIH
jgi:hypothetical protein